MQRPPERRRRPLLDRPAALARSDDAFDPAASYARFLLRSLGLEIEVPDRADPRSPALEWALSGAMALTGVAAGPPGFARGPLASAAHGAGLALAALVPGRGFEDLDAPALLAERAALFGFTRQGGASCGGSARLLPTRLLPNRLLPNRRGWLALNLPRDEDWQLLPAWLEIALPNLERTRDWSAVERALAGRACEPLVLRGREIGLAVAEALLKPIRPDAPFRLEHETRAAIARPRPRVLDLSTLWAGPLAGSLLAQAGAEVLKVESPHRPDGARLGEQQFFSLLNAHKHGCALDLAARPDREIFVRLLESADIVLESARPRALAQLGIDARAWVEARPGRIWASITGYGREHEWIAFGDDAAVAAGLAFDPGSESSPPRFCADAVADPLTGLVAAVAITALRARGRGGLLSLALAEVAAHAAHAPHTLHATPQSSLASLTLPLEQRVDGEWWVQDAERSTRVAPPRAREAHGRPPALAPPNASLVERWTRAC